MSNMEYQDFKKLLSNYSFQYGEKYESILSAMERFLDEKEIKIFYPKFLFLDDKQLEVQIYQKNQLIIFHNKQPEVKIEVLPFKQINKVELMYGGYYQPWGLEINFHNGDIIRLNNKEDTNSSWNRHFTTKIEAIFNLLINSGVSTSI
jgi:hypothetical protein